MDSKPLVIALMVAAWRRYPVAELCYAGIERLQAHCLSANVVLRPLVIFSEKHHELAARSRGWDAVYHANDQGLGAKMNAGYRYLLDQEFDYFMQLGADDLLSNLGMSKIIQHMRDEVKFAGFRSLYVCKFSTKQVMAVDGGVIPFGAGRFVAADVFRKAGDQVLIQLKDIAKDQLLQSIEGTDKIWVSRSSEIVKDHEVLDERIGLWTDALNKGLDGDSMERIMNVHPSIKTLDGTHIVDIKDESSIHKYELFEDAAHSPKGVAFTELLSSFPELRKI